jgi:hypothetical protein
MIKSIAVYRVQCKRKSEALRLAGAEPWNWGTEYYHRLTDDAAVTAWA